MLRRRCRTVNRFRALNRLTADVVPVTSTHAGAHGAAGAALRWRGVLGVAAPTGNAHGAGSVGGRAREVVQRTRERAGSRTHRRRRARARPGGWGACPAQVGSGRIATGFERGTACGPE